MMDLFLQAFLELPEDKVLQPEVISAFLATDRTLGTIIESRGIPCRNYEILLLHLKDPEMIYFYISRCLNRRWPEAESALSEHKAYMTLYNNNFPKNQ